MGHIRDDDVVASALRDSATGLPDAENATNRADVALLDELIGPKR